MKLNFYTIYEKEYTEFAGISPLIFLLSHFIALALNMLVHLINVFKNQNPVLSAFYFRLLKLTFRLLGAPFRSGRKGFTLQNIFG